MLAIFGRDVLFNGVGEGDGVGSSKGDLEDVSGGDVSFSFYPFIIELRNE